MCSSSFGNILDIRGPVVILCRYMQCIYIIQFMYYTLGIVYQKCIGGVYQRPCGYILEELWQNIEWSFCKILPISCRKGFHILEGPVGKC